MERDERIRRRDRQKSFVRRVTGWTAVGSLAVAAGVGTIFGVGHAATTGSASKTTTTGTTNSSTGSGLQSPTQAPTSSSKSGSVTSGGS